MREFLEREKRKQAEREAEKAAKAAAGTDGATVCCVRGAGAEGWEDRPGEGWDGERVLPARRPASLARVCIPVLGGVLVSRVPSVLSSRGHCVTRGALCVNGCRQSGHEPCMCA